VRGLREGSSGLAVKGGQYSDERERVRKRTHNSAQTNVLHPQVLKTRSGSNKHVRKLSTCEGRRRRSITAQVSRKHDVDVLE
jgi:hypothetical protein